MASRPQHDTHVSSVSEPGVKQGGITVQKKPALLASLNRGTATDERLAWSIRTFWIHVQYPIQDFKDAKSSSLTLERKMATE